MLTCSQIPITVNAAGFLMMGAGTRGEFESRCCQGACRRVPGLHSGSDAPGALVLLALGPWVMMTAQGADVARPTLRRTWMAASLVLDTVFFSWLNWPNSCLSKEL